jgi:hypothetical protein
MFHHYLKVLDTVEQTGSSLQRFRQRKTAATVTTAGDQAPPPPADSDEVKIRAQLVFDVNFVRQRVRERHPQDGDAVPAVAAQDDRLARLEQRAAAVAGQPPPQQPQDDLLSNS